MKYLLFLSAFALCISIPGFAQDQEPGTGVIAEKIAGASAFPGYIPFYWDENAGKLWLEIERLDEELLYVNSLSAGIGSNDIGLDRNQLGDSRIVRFKRVGPKVLLVHPNYQYRADTENAAERRAVEEAFAQSILWGFDIEAEEDGRLLVDATTFFLRDAHQVTRQLQSAGQGSYSLDASRSAFHLERTKNFERNSEFEVTLTFTGEPKGPWIRSVTPSPDAVTVRQHHSFVQLPDGDYTPRVFDPRAGAFSISYYDYAAPIDAPIEKRFIARHRLKKAEPTHAVSDPVEPIVYYLDPGTPEPIRSALLEGAAWWNQAFEAIGYRDAFQVRMLPEDADPMDLRYNVINWVHRSTRGWSYGSSVIDPRTGEIIKGHVTLGSLRVRQDFLIATGLKGPYDDEADTAEISAMALARIRQLSAHEVGHTLGFAHNYISSAQNRASVMDYPHPVVRVTEDGELSLDDAYDEGIGAWDKVAVAYAYQDFPRGVNEKAALNRVLQDAIADGILFLSDQDARPLGSAHPETHLWDNGADAADELANVLKIREIALAHFSERNIPHDAPMATLEEVLVPIYFYHRYQVEAAAKMVGGLRYRYALRGDGQPGPHAVEANDQRRALGMLLRALNPAVLALPEHILALVPPRAYGTSRHREVFDIRTGFTLDPIGIAQTAADEVVALLLHPQRAARLVEQHGRNAKLPSLLEVLDRVLEATWKADTLSGLEGEVQRAVRYVVLQHLMSLAADDSNAPQVRATASFLLESVPALIDDWSDVGTRIQRDYAIQTIERFRENPEQFVLRDARDMPPGSPIGSIEAHGSPGRLLHCD